MLLDRVLWCTALLLWALFLGVVALVEACERCAWDDEYRTVRPFTRQIRPRQRGVDPPGPTRWAVGLGDPYP